MDLITGLFQLLSVFILGGSVLFYWWQAWS
jgi:hypothetical protein